MGPPKDVPCPEAPRARGRGSLPPRGAAALVLEEWAAPGSGGGRGLLCLWVQLPDTHTSQPLWAGPHVAGWCRRLLQPTGLSSLLWGWGDSPRVAWGRDGALACGLTAEANLQTWGLSPSGQNA